MPIAFLSHSTIAQTCRRLHESRPVTFLEPFTLDSIKPNRVMDKTSACRTLTGCALGIRSTTRRNRSLEAERGPVGRFSTKL